ncbi:hypothetical protein C2E23DRAFT_889387 [Lenzites betulinus]|nr:hypothetical protein C2E23DRAFT_889387 [Lenzites betulinus]
MSIATLAQLPSDSFDGELISALTLLVEKTRGLVSHEPAIADEDIIGDAPVDDKPALLQDASRAATFFVSLNTGDDDATSPKIQGDDVEKPREQLQVTDMKVKTECVQVADPPLDDSSDAESLRSPVSLECPPGLHAPPSSPTTSGLPTACLTIPLPDASLSEDEGIEPKCAVDATDTEVRLDDIFSIDPTVFQDAWHAYSLTRLEPLQTFIPDSIFPDDLLVHDPDGLTRAFPRAQSNKPLRYVRIYPYAARPEPGDAVHTADLYLRRRNQMGTGHHSRVIRAPLELRLDPGSDVRSRVSVAVKMAATHCGAHKMLRQEAALYNEFPRDIMEDSVSRADAEAAAKSACSDALSADDDSPATSSAAEVDAPAPPLPLECTTPISRQPDEGIDEPVLVPAIVPKFFGYYSLVNEDGELCDRSNERFIHHLCCDDDGTCYVPKWPTSILLLEECGREISKYLLSHEARYARYFLDDVPSAALTRLGRTISGKNATSCTNASTR